MSNLGLEQALQRMGLTLERTAVGDRYIMQRLQEKQWVLGGEPSGHVICLDRTSTGDGIISALQVLAEMRDSGKSLRDLRSGIDKFPQQLVNVRVSGERDVLGSRELGEAIRSAERELGSQGRILLRPSGTEPLLRVMVEGRDRDVVLRLAQQLADVVRDLGA